MVQEVSCCLNTFWLGEVGFGLGLTGKLGRAWVVHSIWWWASWIVHGSVHGSVHGMVHDGGGGCWMMCGGGGKPCTNPCTAQLARQPQPRSDPTKPRGIWTT